MVDKLLQAPSGVLTRRVLLNTFLPSVAFCILVTAVITAGAHVGRFAREWTAQPVGQQVWQAVALLIVAALLAQLLESRRSATVRFFEGYWATPLGRTFARAGVSHHTHRVTRLLAAAPEGDDSAHLRYPLPVHAGLLMPTRLGNILRSGESYPRARYGMDLVVVWPRLYHVLPERFVAHLASARSGLDRSLGQCVLTWLLTLVTAVSMLARETPWWVYLGSVTLGAVLCWAEYHAGLAYARTYAQHLRSACDLYRHELLKQLDHTPPTDATRERRLWESLVQFWHRGIPMNAADGSPAPAPPPGQPAAAPRWTPSLTTVMSTVLAVLIVVGAGYRLLVS